MSRRRWESDLDSATNEHDIVAISRDYMAWLSRAENALLPLRYRPGPFDCIDDVHEAAARLAKARTELAPGDILDIISEMADFFAAAQARLRSGALAPFVLAQQKLGRP